jgi:iron complex transport system ATP-binding protein
MIELEACEVTAGYDGDPVLNRVSVALRQGEFVGLIGPNGCGKSTLLKCLSRILKPRAGRIALDGRDLYAMTHREIARRMAFVPQQETALFEFAVRDLVLMGRHPHLERWKGETEGDYRIVAQALADADILHLADRPVTQLSGGEHRRVLLARALAQQTPLLLLDEPTAHLDVTHQAELLDLVHRQTRTQGQGALAALHDLNQAAQFCDRLILMCRGRVVAEGAPEAVLTADNLKVAYNAESQIGTNPVTGRPMLLAVRGWRDVPPAPGALRVHVVCGGGTGAEAMAALLRAGCSVSTGVLNRLDTDLAAAEALGVAAVVEAPFSPIGPEARAACAEVIGQAQAVIVTPIPIGNGNLANLELALEAQSRGVPVVLLGSVEPSERDHTGGAGALLLERLIAAGADRYPCVEEWLGSLSVPPGR